jgi:hypothetical protein
MAGEELKGGLEKPRASSIEAEADGSNHAGAWPDMLADHNLAIGPAYFMKSKSQSDSDISDIWRYSILPLLEDHFYGQWDTRKSEFQLEDFK